MCILTTTITSPSNPHKLELKPRLAMVPQWTNVGSRRERGKRVRGGEAKVGGLYAVLDTRFTNRSL